MSATSPRAEGVQRDFASRISRDPDTRARQFFELRSGPFSSADSRQRETQRTKMLSGYVRNRTLIGILPRLTALSLAILAVLVLSAPPDVAKLSELTIGCPLRCAILHATVMFDDTCGAPMPLKFAHYRVNDIPRGRCCFLSSLSLIRAY